MKSALRMRHWCDFCKKSGQIGAHILKHESGCTLNPARKCRMCALEGLDQKSIQELGDTLRGGDFKALEEAAEHRPACILATLRQTNHGGWTDPDAEPNYSREDDGRHAFDFKTAAAAFWNRHNAEHHSYF